jgi:hypothetical protein
MFIHLSNLFGRFFMTTLIVAIVYPGEPGQPATGT